MKALIGTGVALVTPFNEDKSIDFDGLTKLVNHVTEGGIDYLVVLGTTGETATLTTEEKDQVLAHVIQANQQKLPIVLGIGGNNTSAILNEFKRVNLEGVAAILSASPYYNKPTQEGIYQHYKCLAEASPLPLVLYNVPGRTASNITAETTLRLAKDFDNVVAMKEASGNINQVMSIVKNMPEDFIVLSGDDALNLAIINCGGTGVISVLGNTLPNLTATVVSKALEGKQEESRNLHYTSLEFIDLLFAEGNPGGVKAALKAQGVCGDEVRLPLVKATNGLSSAIKKELERF